MPPVIDCVGPTGAQTVMFPVAEWTYIADPETEAVQATVTFEVFDAPGIGDPDPDPETDTPLATTTTEDSAARRKPLTSALPAGHYVGFIEATDTNDEVSGWCRVDFAVVASTTGATVRPRVTAAGQLGCGTHVVRVQGRGGSPVLAEVGWESLSYGYKVDNMTDGRVTVGAAGLTNEKCCLALSGLRAWEHEVSIWRNGKEAWVGVVGDPDFGPNNVTIPARDLFQWMERRHLEHDRDFVGFDLALVFRQYVLDALERDPSPNILVEITGSSAVGDRSVLASARRRAADELRSIASSGVDFTMRGRRLLVGGPELPLPQLPVLTDGDVDDPHILPSGLDAATEVSVIGATDQNTGTTSTGQLAAIPHSGKAGGVDPVLGLVQATINDSTLNDDASCAAVATTRLALLSGAADFVTAVLRPSAPVSFDDLIPGTRWPAAISAACRSVNGMFRLAEVTVDATSSDQGDTETIKVTLEPLGTTDDLQEI